MKRTHLLIKSKIKPQMQVRKRLKLLEAIYYLRQNNPFYHSKKITIFAR